MFLLSLLLLLYRFIICRHFLCKEINEQIDRLYVKFWWGEQEGNRKLHTTKWSEICKSVSEGELGIRESNNK